MEIIRSTMAALQRDIPQLPHRQRVLICEAAIGFVDAINLGFDPPSGKEQAVLWKWCVARMGGGFRIELYIVTTLPPVACWLLPVCYRFPSLRRGDCFRWIAASHMEDQRRDEARVAEFGALKAYHKALRYLGDPRCCCVL